MSRTAADLGHRGAGLVLLVVVLAAVLLFNSRGTVDVALFMRWMSNISRFGVVEGYRANDTVQPPLYAVIFWVVARGAEWLQVGHFTAYKTSLFVGWLLTGLCLRQWTPSGVVIALVLFALIPNSMALGYFDIYLAPLLLSAFWAARERHWALFSASFTIFALAKAQGLILVPFAAVFAAKVVLRARGTWGDTAAVAIRLALPAVVIGGLVFAVFGNELLAALQYASDTHVFSGNALNLCWVLTHYVRAARPELFGGLRPDGTAEWLWLPAMHGLKVWMRVAFFTVYGLILLAYTRQTASLRDFVYYSLLGYLAYFVLNTGVHENHLFYAALLAVVLFLIDDRFVYHAVICCLAANVNMMLFYGLTGGGLPVSRVVGIDLAVVFAGVNVVLFCVAVAPIFAPQDCTVCRCRQATVRQAGEQ